MALLPVGTPHHYWHSWLDMRCYHKIFLKIVLANLCFDQEATTGRKHIATSHLQVLTGMSRLVGMAPLGRTMVPPGGATEMITEEWGTILRL